MRGSSSRTALAIVLALLVGMAPARADDDVQAKARTLLMLRILAYDHALKQRAGERLSIVVLHHPTNPVSLRRRDEILDSFTGLEKIRVGGLPIVVNTVPFGDPALVAAAARALRPAAIIVCPGLTDDVAAISALARAGTMLSFASSETELRLGLAVAIVPDDKRDRIIINLAASRAEGVKFDAVLLQLASVYDGAPP
jgi:uncharacterized protein DUF4154